MVVYVNTADIFTLAISPKGSHTGWNPRVPKQWGQKPQPRGQKYGLKSQTGLSSVTAQPARYDVR